MLKETIQELVLDIDYKAEEISRLTKASALLKKELKSQVLEWLNSTEFHSLDMELLIDQGDFYTIATKSNPLNIQHTFIISDARDLGLDYAGFIQVSFVLQKDKIFIFSSRQTTNKIYQYFLKKKS